MIHTSFTFDRYAFSAILDCIVRLIIVVVVVVMYVLHTCCLMYFQKRLKNLFETLEWPDRQKLIYIQMVFLIQNYSNIMLDIIINDIQM